LGPHARGGMRVGVPYPGGGTGVPPGGRPHPPPALPLLAAAATETLTWAPPAVLPSTCASTPTPLRFSVGGVVSITPSPESLVPFTGLVSGCERTMVPVWLPRFWDCVSRSPPKRRSVEESTCFGAAQNGRCANSGLSAVR